MTNLELLEMRRRHRHLTERAKTIVAELRSQESAVAKEAAEVIEWLLDQNQCLRNNLNQEIKDGQRQAQDAYFQGQQDEFDKNRLA